MAVNDFDLQYRQALKMVMEEGLVDFNRRTGHRTKMIPGIFFKIEAGFPLLTLRRIPLRVFVAEMIWYLTGSRMPLEFLQKFTKIWDDFTNIDGVVTTAYGYRWRRHFGRDQIEGLVGLLKKDPSSRHGVVVTWDPADDGLTNSLTVRRKMNIPCPYTFVANVVAGRLNLYSVARSTDMILGCPHDVAGFALLQRILAAHLGFKVGTFVFTTAHAHVYDIHYRVAGQLLRRPAHHPKIELKAGKDWLTRAQRGDEELVEEIVSRLEKQYRPGAVIKGLKIVI